MAKITSDSHLDHALNGRQVDFVKELIANLEEFTIKTVELPDHLGTVPCGLHGPIMGDDPVPGDEVRYEARNGRPGLSRLCDRGERPTRKLSLIVGPHNGDIILYTAFGGPVAPREPFDPAINQDKAALDESYAFWKDHALTAERIQHGEAE